MTIKTTSTPQRFICPITNEVMLEPVVTVDGLSFERTALLRHLATNNRRCPVTGNKLNLSDVHENGSLVLDIDQWRQELDGPPREFICPLTKELMIEPVAIPSGNFEREALLRYLASNDSRCPLTGDKVHLSEVRDHSLLAHKTQQWREERGLLLEIAEQHEEEQEGSQASLPEVNTIDEVVEPTQALQAPTCQKVVDQKVSSAVTLKMAQHRLTRQTEVVYGDGISDDKDGLLGLLDEVRTVLEV